MKKLLSVLFIIMLCTGIAYAGQQSPYQAIEQILQEAQRNAGYRTNPYKNVRGNAYSSSGSTQASEFLNLTTDEAVAKIGEMCRADMARSGILASVSAAQFILEADYGKSELAQNANNCFGMKCQKSGNNWQGSTWDGVSSYRKSSGEEENATYTLVASDFRKYASVEDSVADHSAYLLGATSGGKKRYDGLAGERNYRTAAQIIKNGGYATSSTYVAQLCAIIEKHRLTDYDY